jgi:GNAT superfamily N-acetyltransferase
MSAPDDALYGAGTRTLLASWEAYAAGAVGAALHRLPGVTVAAFPHQPERGVYNNAVLEQDLAPADRAAALDVMEATYGAAGITPYAAWVHESDEPMCRALELRGYAVDTATRAMGMFLDDLALPRPELAVGTALWSEYLAAEGLAPDFLQGADHDALHLLVARIDGEIVSAALAVDHGEDCGIYNVGTAAGARRRGLGTAVTLAQLHDARDRGRRTASLQSTFMAERVYAALGFRDLGRILEFTPAPE